MNDVLKEAVERIEEEQSELGVWNEGSWHEHWERHWDKDGAI